MYAIFVVGVGIVVAAGVLCRRTRPAASSTVQGVLAPLARVRDVCLDELGRYGAAVAVLLAAAAAAVIVCWPFGRFARRFQSGIDEPWLRWTQRHTSTHGGWHHVNSVLTEMGNRPEIKVICLVAAVGFGLVWAQRRQAFWVPALVMAATFGFEKFGQTTLTAVVNRPKVALPDFGSYPSGGVARLITVYGMVFYLLLLTWPSISRTWRVAGWTVVGVLAFVEGYTRVYLIKHWGMDVVGGWLYGTLMLLALLAAASCFAPALVPPRRRTTTTGVDNQREVPVGTGR
jgi:membrane-associated phospholipid phosphatase